MNITPVNFYKNDTLSPGFRAWNRCVYANGKDSFVKEIAHRNDTSFVRHLGVDKKACGNASSWLKVMDYLVNKYKNVSRVNIYNYACSDGSEPYTFLIALLSRYDKETQKKFNKIIAIDHDKEAILKAKKGIYQISQRELDNLQELSNNNIDEFLNIEYNPEENIYNATVKDMLKSKIKFINADILKDYKRISPKNSIVFARNFWPYLKENMAKLLSHLNLQMGENSTLIIGDYDKRGCSWHGFNILQEITKKGFKSSKIDYLYEK